MEMKYSNIHRSCKKIFLSGIFALIACVSLQAEEKAENAVIFVNADTLIVGRKYLVIKSDSEKYDTSQEQNAQPKLKIGESQIFIKNSSCIFIADSAKIYAKDYLFAHQNNSHQVSHRGNNSRVAGKKGAKHSNDEVNEEQTTVVANFPLLPSSSSFLFIGRESAATILQKRPLEYQSLYKSRQEKCYLNNGTSFNVYLPEQRQKLSTAATQCGILTSFSPNSPTVV